MKKIVNMSPYKKLKDGVSVFMVEFEDGSNAFISGKKTELFPYIGLEVEAVIEEDLVDGELVPVIQKLTELVKKTALTKDKNIKFFVEEIPKLESSLDFSLLEEDELYPGAVLYCSAVTFKRKDNGVSWYELSMLDVNRKVKVLRLFNPEKKVDCMAFRNRYVKGDIKLTKFGLNAEELTVLDWDVADIDPRIQIAEKFVRQIIKDDSDLEDWVDDKVLLEKLRQYPSEREVGELLIKLGIELALAQDYSNVMRSINRTTLIRALVAAKSFVLTDDDDNLNSHALQAVLASAKLDKSLRTILQDNPKRELPERVIMKKIQEDAETVMEVERGLYY